MASVGVSLSRCRILLYLLQPALRLEQRLRCRGEMSEMDSVARAAAACLTALPDDLIAEILVLVKDSVSLFRCTVVCKRWRRIVAEPPFLRRVWPEGGRPSLLGFFVQRHRINASARRKISRRFPSRTPAFVPAPDSLLGPERRFLTSFIRGDDGTLDEAKPLAARGGLLLVRLAPCSSDKTHHLRLCVCNLLTGRRETLPLLSASFLNSDGVAGYGLTNAADHGAGPHPLADGYSTLFQVLLIGKAHDDRDRDLFLIKFSSAATQQRRWFAYNCTQQTGVRMGQPYGCCIATIAGGTAHWLFRGGHLNPTFSTLDVDVNTGCISATAMQIEAAPQLPAWLCMIDARIALFHLSDNQLFVWSHGNKDGTLGWYPTRFFELGVETLFDESLSPVCVGEHSDTVLALYHSNPKFAYMLDLRSGSVTKVAGWTRLFNYMTAVPCEIHWPAFFMSRLCVQM